MQEAFMANMRAAGIHEFGNSDVLRLEDIAKAHDLVAEGHVRGKVVVRLV
jgi:hypothetical protein